MVKVIKHRKVSFIFSAVLFVASLVALFTFGLKPGIDFTGGSLMEVKFTGERPESALVEEVVTASGVELASIQPTGEEAYILKMPFISEDQHQVILGGLRDQFEKEATEEMAEVRVLEERLETIGPSISAELKERSWESAVVVITTIILFVAFAFRRVSKPVSSWKFGITAIIALVHDVVITMGVFALLGHLYGVEIDIPFVVAMLTILGYSVNDTIVVFDRIREKLIKRGRDKFEDTVEIGVRETFVRSLNTSITTLLVLSALFFFGGESIKYFSLALIVGIFLGTYSSIFLASPLLVVWSNLKRNK